MNICPACDLYPCLNLTFPENLTSGRGGDGERSRWDDNSISSTVVRGEPAFIEYFNNALAILLSFDIQTESHLFLRCVSRIGYQISIPTSHVITRDLCVEGLIIADHH
jgi:hypothetical protein